MWRSTTRGSLFAVIDPDTDGDRYQYIYIYIVIYAEGFGCTTAQIDVRTRTTYCTFGSFLPRGFNTSLLVQDFSHNQHFLEDLVVLRKLFLLSRARHVSERWRSRAKEERLTADVRWMFAPNIVLKKSWHFEGSQSSLLVNMVSSAKAGISVFQQVTVLWL